jgi:hypothetical protein
LSVVMATDSKPIKQEVNRTVILPPLVFPGTYNVSFALHLKDKLTRKNVLALAMPPF